MDSLKILCEEFFVDKPTKFGVIKRSLGQDRVFAETVDKKWRQVGLYMHAANTFCPLAGTEPEIVKLVAEGIAKVKKLKSVGYVDSPVTEPPKVEQDDEED